MDAHLERQLAEVLEQLEQTPGAPAANRETGRLLCRLGRHAEAQPYLERATEGEREAANGWLYLHVAAGKGGDAPAAHHALERYEQLIGEDARGLARRATHLRAVGEPQAAVEYAHRALALDPDSKLQCWIH
ncbi:MAG TPA: hypothetical protein VK689_08265, partial [Armatimonadota bacterium]|nr:hypothetical protein [Armatimonadota bacterium]